MYDRYEARRTVQVLTDCRTEHTPHRYITQTVHVQYENLLYSTPVHLMVLTDSEESTVLYMFEYLREGEESNPYS